jgi:PEP-CTERM motif
VARRLHIHCGPRTGRGANGNAGRFGWHSPRIFVFLGGMPVSIVQRVAGFCCAAALAACIVPLSAARADVISFGSDTSWNTSDASNNPLGPAEFVLLSPALPARRPPGAVILTPNLVGWSADLTSIPNAFWIWAPGITGASPNPAFAQYSFTKQFNLPGTPVSGTISIAADDFAEVFVNSSLVGQIGSVSNVSLASAAQSALTTFDLTPFLVSGQNTITVLGENGPFGNTANYAGDPAGVVFGGSLQFSPAAPVPEPSSLALFALGGLGLTVWRRWRKRRE